MNYWFSDPVSVATKIKNKLNLRMVGRNLHAKFGICSIYNNWDLSVHTDGQLMVLKYNMNIYYKSLLLNQALLSIDLIKWKLELYF